MLKGNLRVLLVMLREEQVDGFRFPWKFSLPRSLLKFGSKMYFTEIYDAIINLLKNYKFVCRKKLSQQWEFHSGDVAEGRLFKYFIFAPLYFIIVGASSW